MTEVVTEPAADPKETVTLSKGELDSLVTDKVIASIGPAIAENLKALTERQTSVMGDMLDASARKAENSKRPKGHLFARHARAMAAAHLEGHTNDPQAAIHYVKRHWGEDDPVLKGLEGTVKLKANQAGNAAQAGNLVIPEYSREFIELLRNRTVIRRHARVLPMPSGSLTMRRQTAAATAAYVGEGLNIAQSSPIVGLFSLQRKKLAGISVQSNDLVRFAGPEADAFVLDDLLAVSAIREDLAFIRGDGTEFTPAGIRNLVTSGNVNAQSATTLAGIDDDFAQAVRQVEEANVEGEERDFFWVMVPRTKWALWNAAPSTDAGARPYRDGLNMGKVLGFDVEITNQVPRNLGGGSDESETYFLHGPSLVIADTLNVQVDVFPGGAYHDGSSVVSGISTDETPIRVLREHDFNMRHVEAGSIITGVTIS